jgi:hypothetical protein
MMRILIVLPYLLHKQRGFADIVDERANDSLHAHRIIIAVDQQHEISISVFVHVRMEHGVGMY